jgi:hypothetical protein
MQKLRLQSKDSDVEMAKRKSIVSRHSMRQVAYSASPNKPEPKSEQQKTS